ncbi:MAG: YwmB family TATA-box binding protein [Clostridioides sp.]|nr:YwmB family TATA-box binding protein [Clostridioides sp.]
MRKLQIIIMAVVLLSVGGFTSYADLKLNSNHAYLNRELGKVGAECVQFNTKINSQLYDDLTKEELENILTESAEIFDEGGRDTEKSTLWSEKEKKVAVEIHKAGIDISMKIIKKNAKETYATVDITEDKVYKHIDGKYVELEKLLKYSSKDIKIYSCIVGKYKKKLQYVKNDDILAEILYNMNAEEIQRIDNSNILSVVAYGKLVRCDNELNYLGKKINLNIAIRDKEDTGETYIYISSPIIKIDY